MCVKRAISRWHHYYTKKNNRNKANKQLKDTRYEDNIATDVNIVEGELAFFHGVGMYRK